VLGYAEARSRLIQYLEAAASAHEAGNLDLIEVGFEEFDELLRREADAEFEKLQIALDFWDGWIDARNHNWHYYEGISASDWPRLARSVIRDLSEDRDISDERIVKLFDWRRRRPRGSLWQRLLAHLGW